MHNKASLHINLSFKVWKNDPLHVSLGLSKISTPNLLNMECNSFSSAYYDGNELDADESKTDGDENG